MLASEFIELLQGLIEEHGDQPLYINGYYCQPFGDEVQGAGFEDLKTNRRSTLEADRTQFMIDPQSDP